MSDDWKMKPFGCCGNGAGFCLYVTCCHCIALKETSDNLGEDKGLLYLLGDLLGFGCCMLALAADDVAKKTDIKGGLGTFMVYSCLDCCLCFSCSVVNESREYKNNPENQQTTTTITQVVTEKIDRDE
uniref:Uncharacterized protein n=1 Tax=Helicotheca tamesis TaxID=374047 RepID=A0A7S2MCK1_9STRA|mmetsp:Transcript_1361/g.1950  ORF Transcript_1361/g.1950 Transcript_1361/m.1950 type:complete len:128 (+) Transcript_1361:85-468(+)